MASACFVSDLHLLSPRSMAGRWMHSIEAACRDSHLIVLGGDIFDFRWATLGGHQASMAAVSQWLRRLITDHAHARIVYIMGNHDSHADMQQLLVELSDQHPNFQWQPESLQVGDCLFCHGDILDAGSQRGLVRYRSKFQHERQASRTAHRIYDAAVAMRLHRTIPKLFHRPRATCSRLSELMQLDSSLDSSPPGHAGQAIRRVFFGHTHVPLYELPLGKVTFYNPGAALRHMNFAPITFDVELTDT